MSDVSDFELEVEIPDVSAEVEDSPKEKVKVKDEVKDATITEEEDIKIEVAEVVTKETEKSKPKAARKVTVETKKIEKKKKADKPCSAFALDPSGAFGACKFCGHLKSDHGAKAENKAKVLLSNLRKKNDSIATYEDLKEGDGACAVFRLDTTAKEFGTCKCGYKRADHVAKGKNKAAMALERLRSSNAEKWRESLTGSGKGLGDGPCNSYRVDTAAAEFGTCMCGYKKDDHKAKEENAAAKMLENLKKKNEAKHEAEAKLAMGIPEEPAETEKPEDDVKELTKQEANAETKPKIKEKKGGGCCVIS